MTPPCFCLTARRFSARWRWARRILRGKNRRNRRLGQNHEKCPGFDHPHHCNGGSRLGSCAQTAVADDIERARRNKGKTERADRIPALPEGSLVPLAPPERLSGVPGKTSGARTDEGEPISLEFHHAELTAVLQAFADFTGLNIIASERVRGAVSLRLDKVPWRRAFDALLDSQGLAMQRHGNVIWVAPAEELAMRERQRLETH